MMRRIGRRLALLVLLWPLAATALELKVELEGVGGELKDNVQAYLDIYQERDDPDLLVSRLHYLHARARQQIEQALQPFGYYRSRIDASLSREGEGWVARYRIDPGPAIQVASVDYRVTGAGRDDPVFPRRFPLQPGDVLDQRRYEAAKKQLLQAAAEQGFLKARMEQAEIRIDLQSYQAHIQLWFDTGPRFLLGQVEFDQDLLAPDFLQRYLEFRPGDPYDLRKILSLQGALLDSEYFRQVEIVPLMDQLQGQQVPIRVVAQANARDKYRLGLGYATDYGPRVTLDWRRRYLGRHGHKGSLTLLLSPRLMELTGEYRIPLQHPRRDFMTLQPQLVDYDTESRKGQAFTFKLIHSVEQGAWRRELGLDLTYEDYTVAEESDNLRELVPYVSWSRVLTDDPIYTTHGSRAKLTLLGTVDGLISQTSYLQGHVSGKWIHSFADRYRFLTRGELGATLASDLLDLSGSRRFFAGGDTSIRGYDLEELGPTNEAGQVVGGRYLAVGSLELERRIAGKWSLALFLDGGNAFDPEYRNEIAWGTGFGVHWRSPLGLIRADIGYALNRDDAPFRLHLIIGPDL